MNYTLIFTVIVIIIAAGYAWQYYKLRRELNEYANRVRAQHITTQIKSLENVASSIASLASTYDSQYTALDAERARLSTVLEQLTDGVLIADAHGIVQFANPAAGRLFQASNPVRRSL